MNPSLRPYQSAALDAIASRFAAGIYRQLLSAATGAGKCLGPGTPVLLYSGEIKPVEQVQTGDLLMGPDSKPRRVLSTCSGLDNLYRVIPIKGDPYVVNEAHILSLKITGLNGKTVSGHRSGDIVNISIGNYLKESPTFRHCAKGWRTGVDFPVGKELPLSPYFLGLWLGDGHAQGPSIINVDEEVISYLQSFGESIGMVCEERTYKDKAPEWAIVQKLGSRKWFGNIVNNALIRYGLINNKHVPGDYLTASRIDRLHLLAGIIDSDGHFNNGYYDLVFKNRRLADDVVFLARSLGFASYKSECRKTCGQTGATGVYYRLSVAGHIDQIPVRVARKQASPRLQKKDALLTGIRVESIGRGQYFGFQIDGDGLFLLGDFTVTHNTEIFSFLIKEKIDAGENCLVLAHRDRLVTQAAQRIEGIVGFGKIGLVNADQKNWWTPCVVATVQSASVEKQLLRAPKFDNVIIDECHRSNSPSYRKVCDSLLRPGGLLLGVTATPNRTDKKGLIPHVFQEVVYEIGMQELIDADYLSKVVGKEIKLPIDFSKIKTAVSTDGIRDYRPEEVKAAFEEANWLERITEGWREVASDRRTIIFVPPGIVDGRGCGMAHSLAEYMRLHRIRAAAVDGTTKKSEQDRVIAEFTNGDIQVLVNVNIFTEGLDIPPIDAVLFARPTQSSIIYSQAIGRGTRPYPGKENCLVIDVTGITDQLAADGQSLMTLGKILPTDEQRASRRAERIKAARQLIRKLWRKHITLTLHEDEIHVRGQIGAKDKKKLDELTEEIKEILAERDAGSQDEQPAEEGGERRAVNTTLLTGNQIEIREIDFTRAAMNFDWDFDIASRVGGLWHGEFYYQVTRPDPGGKYLVESFLDRHGRLEPLRERGLWGEFETGKEARAFIERQIAANELNKQRIFKDRNAPWRQKQITEKQQKRLEIMNIPIPPGCTSGQASDLLDAALRGKKVRAAR